MSFPPAAIPSGRTARRLEWPHLPPPVRAVIEHRLGAPVTKAVSQRAGYTPGFASVLSCADGTRHFVKAASSKAQRAFAESYREEARQLRRLPPDTPAPRLQWKHDDDDWVVLGLEYVDARLPERPWTNSDLEAASTMLVETARILTPAPGIAVTTAAESFADWPRCWDAIRATGNGTSYDDEAASLAARFAEVVGGDTLCHTEVRDDNLLIGVDGTWLCDWNSPVVGAPWLDSLMLLIGPWADGLDVDAHIAGHPLLADVDPEHIDVVLALLAGYFLIAARGKVPSNSPYVREIQRWQGEACWEWLCARRDWT